jgi:hypothetical protein
LTLSPRSPRRGGQRPRADIHCAAPCGSSAIETGHRGRKGCRDGNNARDFVVWPRFLSSAGARWPARWSRPAGWFLCGTARTGNTGAPQPRRSSRPALRRPDRRTPCASGCAPAPPRTAPRCRRGRKTPPTTGLAETGLYSGASGGLSGGWMPQILRPQVAQNLSLPPAVWPQTAG